MAELESIKGSIAQTDIVVIPIIDVSGSMAGTKIGQVNTAMESVPEQLVRINDGLEDCVLRVAPMEFSTQARWLLMGRNEPFPPEEYRWRQVDANGLTALGEVCKLLNDKLRIESEGGWMKGRGGAAPVIILMSDGAPTDGYESQLKVLKQRGWFRGALKFAIAIGDDADRDVLAAFTGSREAVLDVTEMGDLSKIISAVIRSASETYSQHVSHTVSSTSAPTAVVPAAGPQTDDQANNDMIAQVVSGVQATLDDTDDLF